MVRRVGCTYAAAQTSRVRRSAGVGAVVAVAWSVVTMGREASAAAHLARRLTGVETLVLAGTAANAVIRRDARPLRRVIAAVSVRVAPRGVGIRLSHLIEELGNDQWGGDPEHEGG